MERDLPILEGVQHRFVTVGDLKLHYAEAGRGDPLRIAGCFYFPGRQEYFDRSGRLESGTGDPGGHSFTDFGQVEPE